jgi:hypothetical protein
MTFGPNSDELSDCSLLDFFHPPLVHGKCRSEAAFLFPSPRRDVPFGGIPHPHPRPRCEELQNEPQIYLGREGNPVIWNSMSVGMSNFSKKKKGYGFCRNPLE